LHGEKAKTDGFVDLFWPNGLEISPAKIQELAVVQLAA